ncbi:MAG: hypothetical protein EHM72_19090, partial [Calditrichaeota bacterium]
MLKTSIIRQPLVKQTDRSAMYELHSRYFCNIHKDIFLRDMSEKDWIIVLADEENHIRGFSTIKIMHTHFNDQQQLFLFSGDTIVHRDFWRTGALAGGFGHMILRLNREHPDIPAYWFLISKGYRTYRFLPVFFKEFYPVHHTATPPYYQSLLNQIGQFKFKDHYDPASGVIKFFGSKDHLSPEMCEIPAGRERDAHVQFFLQKNPGYIYGDELACIAAISPNNLNKAGHRTIDNTAVTWHE